MSIPAPRITWTRRRLAVIVSTVLVLVLAGAVAVRASETAAPGGPFLQVSATGLDKSTGQWVELSAPIQVGEPSLSTGFTIPVGAEAHMTVVGDLAGGETSYCTSGRYYWRFDAWSSWSVDGWEVTDWSPNREIHLYDLHDIDHKEPNPDYQVTVNYVYECA